MLGGEDGPCARAEPLLREMGVAPIRTGPVGSAHAMKALNNYVYAAGLLAAAEAVHMAAALGLDTAVFTDVLNASSGRNVATETKLKSDVLTGRYAAGFQLGLMRKDLETAGAIADETGFDAPSLALCRSPLDAKRWRASARRSTTRRSTASSADGSAPDDAHAPRRAPRPRRLAAARRRPAPREAGPTARSASSSPFPPAASPTR